ncbi:MarR family winged helix-turn-helix transcriptional regulator [Subtercola boreus]|uniref:MarR family winged helix-turn-helix transcriptional regulator n=1 Tax=Subtercola boreus TaxID=120213 RepID=UPI001C0F31CC|nr:MarR family transcriptional regulator [Subtercola boreus]
MPNRKKQFELEMPGGWAKKYFFASGALMEAVLRPFDLGNTQWYVLYRLSLVEHLGQRDLTLELGVERATVSGVISALVRKGLVQQSPDPEDQRQKLLSLTPSGLDLWLTLPDPAELIGDIAFAGEDPADIATMNRLLQNATQRLLDYRKGITQS